jgi:hypothetical protein
MIDVFMGATEEEQDRILDKRTGKLKAGALALLQKLQVIQDKKEFGLSYVLASPTERLEKDNALYQAGLDVIATKEKKINDKYDQRIKALDEIGKAQERNNAAQQGELDIAEALSRGDIAAAAKAAYKMRQDAAQQAIADAKERAELARKNELGQVNTKIQGENVSRADLEEKIRINSEKIVTAKKIELDRQISIGKNAVIAAEQSAILLANSKLISKLPGANTPNGTGNEITGGNNPTSGTNPTVGNTTPSPTNPPRPTPTSDASTFDKNKLRSAFESSKQTSLQNASAAANNKFATSINKASKDYGLDTADLKIAAAKGKIDMIYSKVKPAQRAAFAETFKTLTKEYKDITDLFEVDGDIQKSNTGVKNRKSIIANLPPNMQANINLLLARQTAYNKDNTDLQKLQDTYKTEAKKFGVENTPWKDIYWETQNSLRGVYVPFHNKQQEMVKKKNNTNSARDALKEFVEQQFGVTDGKSWFNLAGFSKQMWDKPNGEIRGWGHYAMGGMVAPKGYARGGGIYGTDTVPAMLTPGEFVIKKSAVDNIGSSKLNKINNGMDIGDSVYNYTIQINVKSESNAKQIADTVLKQIERVDAQRLRGVRI